MAALVQAPAAEAALAFAEAFAPEHLELAGAAAEALAPRVRRAGCVFVGRESAVAFGDYVAGSNHSLPTGGAARFASGLSARVVPPAHGRGADRPRGAGARARRGAHRARRGLRAPRGVDGGARGWVTPWPPGRPAPPRSTARRARPTCASTLTLDGTGAGERSTGIGFLDHMLDLLARHGRLDLDVAVRGDLETGGHHTAEDTGIVLGQALDRALGDRAGITRYGHAVVPMDEARASCAIDVSGRPFLALDADLLPPG